MSCLRRPPALSSFLFIVVFLFVAALPVHADVIVLTDGNVLLVEKAWIEGDEVRYQTADGVESLPRNRVRRIQQENATPAAGPQKWSLSSSSGSVSAGPDEFSAEAVARLRANQRAKPSDPLAKSELIRALNSVATLQLSQGNLPAAKTSLEEALNLDGRNVVILTNLAIVHLRMGSYTDAESLLRTCLEIDGTNQDTYYLLGEAYYREEEIAQAISQWSAGLKLGANAEISRRLEKARKEEQVHDELGVLRSTHFILRYDRKVPDQRLGQQILVTLERLYVNLTRELVARPPATVAVILYPDQAYFDITRASGWSGALFDGKIRVPTRGLTGVTPELTATLTHELTHSFMDSLPGDCPTWFHEGVAQLQEGRSAEDHQRVLSEWSQSRQLIPLQDLEGSFVGFSAAAAEMAYAESLSAVDYMIARFGRLSVRRVLDLMAQNYNFDDAFRAVVGRSVAEFETVWKQSLVP